MPNNLDDFYFDVNFGFGSEGIFSLIDKIEEGTVTPPIEGYFLLTDNTPLLLTDLENLALA